MRHVQETDQRENLKANRVKRTGRRWGNFVIRKGSIRSSFNAFLIKLKDHPNVGVYEIRMAVRTKATNYEKGVE